MNLSNPTRAVERVLHSLLLRARYSLPRQHCRAFVPADNTQQSGIGPVYVINLDREPDRWSGMVRALDRIVDASGVPLRRRAIRYSACDAQLADLGSVIGIEVDPVYTLRDQLFVEPQPHVLPDAFDLERPIDMTQAEIAVARSHIGVWHKIAESEAQYSLVLEDDVFFDRRFGRALERAWCDLEHSCESPCFDLLYVSYKEVRHGAPKELVSRNLFRPERGLWYLSGYVLSKGGARALLDLLPCRGPIDLWLNQNFRLLEILALRRSMINQRRDLRSTNSYSILPALSRIGVLDTGDASLFHSRLPHRPVFAFGTPESGLSSLAMALSMLGYRCCSDFDEIPESELERLLKGGRGRIFDAYVNVTSIGARTTELIEQYPHAKYIVILDESNSADPSLGEILDALRSADVLRLAPEHAMCWRPICEHLRLAPPVAPYPVIPDIGLRKYLCPSPEHVAATPARWTRHDSSPWVAKRKEGWTGISASPAEEVEACNFKRLCFDDEMDGINSARWFLRSDTFPGNLGLFRPANVTAEPSGGQLLSVIEEPLGVRNLSAAAISSRASFLFGRFEATLQAARAPGVVTGFFLHRNSPRQEIDIEILGNRPDQLLVNVFYNPGMDGARFDYGYRGTPAILRLGFDASLKPHHYAIEWDPCEIRWFVDRKLVHRRAVWGPTPIPHLPMTLHLNSWPTRSRELAGRLAHRALPASAVLRRVAVYVHPPEPS